MIFTLTHVPQVPGWITRTEMSDKAMHFLGYTGLAYLVWCVFFPGRRTGFFDKPTWLVIAVIAVYGAADEWLQGFVHRTPDVWDWTADMSGTLVALCALGFFNFRAASFFIAAVIAFIVTVLAKVDVLAFVPVLDVAFYFAVYAFLTVMWAGLPLVRRIARAYIFLPFAFSVPAMFLVFTLLCATYMNKQFELSRIIAAVLGIVFASIFAKLYYSANA